MTRRRKKHRPSEPHYPERSGRIAPALQVRRLYRLSAVCGFLLLAVVAVFGQTAGHEFINFDDDQYVTENVHVMRGLTGEGIAWAITTYHASNWHPLTWLSHILDCQLYGLKPGGHHLTNVFLHAAAAILLFLALQRMTGTLWPSAWVAAVFAIHPLRVESVAWVAERKDVLSGLFFMLTLWCYARYVERPASWGRYLWVVAAFALGLTAKPMLVTLPFVLLLLDYWPLGRLGPSRGGSREDEGNPPRPYRLFVRLVVEKIPLFVLAAASCAVTLAAQLGAMRTLEQIAFPWRVANAAVSYVAYLGQMFYPAGLAVLYPLPAGPPPAWKVVAAVTVLLAISTAVFVVRRRCPYLLFGWLWYLGTLVPVIGLVQVGNQAMADRYSYLTQIGLYIAIAWGAAHAAATWPARRWGIAAVSALVVAGLMRAPGSRRGIGATIQTLWTHTLDYTSQNPLAHSNLGLALARRGQLDEAIAHYQKALEFEPDYVSAHNNLGFALVGRGQIDEAIAHFRKVLKIDPNNVIAHNNLGLALARRGQLDEAIAHYQKALEIKPDYTPTHNNLATAYARRGQVDEAIAHYRKALEIRPDSLEAHFNLGTALAGRGQVDEAIEHFQKALGMASTQNDKALAETIRAQIRLYQSVAPAGNAP